MVSVTHIQAFGAAHAKEALDLLCALAVIPAPSHHEEKRAAFCKAWWESRGVSNVTCDAVGNVIAPFGDVSGPLTVIAAHSDVVFPDETPLPLTLREGKVCCPGVGDDTANVVALMLAGAYLAENGIVPSNGGVLLVVNVGEEGLGNLKGSRQLIDDYGDRMTAFVSFDCSSKELIDHAVGSKRYRIDCTATGGHSYFDFGRPNAIAQLCAVVGDLYALSVPHGTTYNVGVIEGGTSVNTIAQHAQVLFELRSDDAAHLEEAAKHFDDVIVRYRERGVSLAVTLLGERPCGKDVDARRQKALVTAASVAIERYFGQPPTRKSGSTDCNIPLSIGVPSVCFGCITGAGMHTREEYIDIDSIEPGLCVALETVLHHCGEDVLG